jgi:hypothetical protein
MFKNSYRIVSDEYSGFEVQTKKWWLPFCWWQCFSGGAVANTHGTIEAAEAFANRHASASRGVKNLGKLP